MTFVLIGGIVLIVAAMGLLGFVLLQNRKASAAEPATDEDSAPKKTRGEDSEAAAKPAATKTTGIPLNFATRSFLLVCTFAFWMLLGSAAYWAYSSEPVLGTILACLAILIYAIVVLLQAVLQQLVGQAQPKPPQEAQG